MSIIKHDGLLFQDSLKYENDIMIESDRLSEYCDYIEQKKCKAVSILYTFTHNNIDFLEKFPWIEHILINTPYVTDVNVINRLPNLKSVFINSTQSIVLYNANIESFCFNWSDGSGIKSSCKNLKTILIDSCKKVDILIEQVAIIPMLIELVLIKPKITNLNFCSKLSNIQNLKIAYASQLVDLSGIIAVKNSLKYIWIENCKKITNFFLLKELKNIERIVLINCGTIPTLSFLREMPKVKDIRFIGTFIEDGDLSPCMGYDYVCCDNKKTYNFTALQLMENK